MLDSNSAWGQDLLYLSDWSRRHPEARPFYLAACGFIDPQVCGIRIFASTGRALGNGFSRSARRMYPVWGRSQVGTLLMSIFYTERTGLQPQATGPGAPATQLA